jgi:putative spermidine/putrescine transport system substrate-binding protein
MEWALMADGVARDDVYALLETPDGVDRALKKNGCDKTQAQIMEQRS